MLLPALLAVVATIPAVTAQESSATAMASYFAYPLFAPSGILGTAISGAPTGPPASSTATAPPGTNSDELRIASNVTATAVAGLEGEAPLNATNVTTIYLTATTTASSYADGSISYLPAPVYQRVTSTSTSASTTMSCATSMGYERRSSVPTSYGFTTTTTTVSITSTMRATVTVTPTATTFTVTEMTTEVITSSQAPIIIPTPAGFNPIFLFAQPAVTGSSRIKRYSMEARDAAEALSLLKRYTPMGNTGGFRVSRNGTTSNIYRRFPQELDCSVRITSTRFVMVVEQGPVESVFMDMDAATSMRTVTVSSTTTVTSEVPRETIYAACQGNNVGTCPCYLFTWNETSWDVSGRVRD